MVLLKWVSSSFGSPVIPMPFPNGLPGICCSIAKHRSELPVILLLVFVTFLKTMLRSAASRRQNQPDLSRTRILAWFCVLPVEYPAKRITPRPYPLRYHLLYLAPVLARLCRLLPARCGFSTFA